MTEDVLIFTKGRAGCIRLNRPKAIHALDATMCAAMIEALDAWAEDPAVEAVLVDHATGRGFCAGGDIRMLAESGAGDGSAARAFFRTEYRMNQRLFAYPKPVATFMDGITMGGGVGISLPARYRVATENTRFAMPETGIGLFPDVGGGWYLSRLPGRMGQFIALTGARLDGAECMALNLATHYLATTRLEEAKARIAQNPHAIAEILDDLGAAAPFAAIVPQAGPIDRLFASDTLEDILAALQADDGEWARKQLAVLRAKSPQACKVSLRLLAEGRDMPSFADEMRQEYAVAARISRLHDFAEGTRAVIVDKDNAPRWNPSAPQSVTDAMIDALFAPLPAGEAWTPEAKQKAWPRSSRSGRATGRGSSMARVAFIGLGNMGGGMAANLAKAGHDVRAFDLSAEALERARAAGCLPAEDAASAIKRAEAVITMLPAGKHVEAVYAESVFDHADPAAILIDCSTIDVDTARRVAEAAQVRGLVAVDAPVSGGITAANAGTLTFMVGGSDMGFDRAEPFLSEMGKAVIHAGASGAGQAAKVCNNMLLGAEMIATCEAFALAGKLGLDLQKFYDIASVSSGQSWSMTSYCPVPGVGPESPADRGYQGGFAAALMLKDLRLAMEAAASTGATTPMGARAAELYEAFVAAGNGATDFSGIFRTMDGD